jgi:hypothetical protein
VPVVTMETGVSDLSSPAADRDVVCGAGVLAFLRPWFRCRILVTVWVYQASDLRTNSFVELWRDQ